MGKKLMASAAALIAASLAVSACSTPQQKSGSSTTPTSSQAGAASGKVTVLWNQYFYSLNGSTSFGNNVTNANVIYATSSSNWYYDKDLKKVNDTSFGTYEKVSDSPLTVKQTIADTAMWSDGQPVKACDYILSYGAQSGLFNTVDGTDLVDGDGNVKKTADVYFDASSEAWKLITEFPEISEDQKTVTYKYSSTYGDWDYALFSAGLPAHIIGKRALGVTDPAAACDAVTKAFKDKDKDALSKIANSWNSDYNFTTMPSDPDLLVTNGPYVISAIEDKKSLTLTANPNYKGSKQPKIKDVTIIYNEDAAASGQALRNGEVAIIEPQATPDLLKTLQGNDKLEVLTGDQASYEHVDLTFNNGGPFDPKAYGGDATKALKVRQAFLKTIPRQKIVDNLIKPLNPNAQPRSSFNLTPGAQGYDDVVASNGMKAQYENVDIEGAKKLLAEAGVPKVTVRFMYAANNPRRASEYTLIKESAAAAGITVLNGADADWSKKLGGGTYDAAMFAWSSGDDSLAGSVSNFITGGQNNYGGYSNKEADDLLNKLKASTDQTEKLALNAQIEKILVDDAFGTAIFQFPNVTAYDKTVIKNVSTIPFNPTYYWNIWQWELV